jgi:ubiquinol-cytochrome c reductase cytochrome b subunit
MRRQGISGPVKPREGTPQPFFPYQAGRDLVVAILAGILLAVLAWKGAPALEPPADPTSSDYVPRPEWYFLGLFQLLKYFPGRLEIIGALILPGLAMTFLAALPWIDRGGTRHWRGRRVVLGAFVAGIVGVISLTTLGALDKPPQQAAGWSVREMAGAALISTGDRCSRCHSPTGVAAPIAAGHIGRAQDWLAMHVADPEMIAAGLREAPATNDRDTLALLAALARMRGAEPPAADDATRHLMVTVNRQCLGCHLIDGVGGKEGPDLSHVGQKYSAELIARRVTNPVDVKPDAEMPSFRGQLTPAEILAIAQWLASRK